MPAAQEKIKAHLKKFNKPVDLGEKYHLLLVSLAISLFLISCVILASVYIKWQSINAEALGEYAEDVIQPFNSREFVSNEILVKVKASEDSKIKSKVSITAPDTGISSLNNLNKELKVDKFEQIVKKGKSKVAISSTGSQKDDVFRWYKITLAEPQEILKDEPIGADIGSGIGNKISPQAPAVGGKPLNEKQEKVQKIKSIFTRYQQNLAF